MSHDFEEVIKGISLAIKEAQKSIEYFALEQYRFLFDEYKGDKKNNKSLSYKPKTVTIPIPDMKGGYVPKEVPIAALIHHHSLILDEVKLKMAVAASIDEKDKRIKVEIGPLNKKESNLASPSSIHEIELVFKKGDAVEGVAKIVQELTQNI